jgi:hypothetical protein
MPIDPRPTYAQQWGLSYGTIDVLDGGANANCNTLIVKAQHRFSQISHLFSLPPGFATPRGAGLLAGHAAFRGGIFGSAEQSDPS